MLDMNIILIKPSSIIITKSSLIFPTVYLF